MASAGKGLPFIGKMNEFLDRVLHPTVQKVGNSRAALDVLNRGYFLLQTTAFIVEAGSTDNILVLTGHPFKEGDGIRIKTAANPIKEIEIVIDEVIDANTVKFAGYLSHSLTAGDEIYGRRPITETFASDGTALATLSYLKDNISVPVARDTVIPTNSTALPVEIMGASGMVLNVTTGDLAIQSIHEDRIINAVTVPGDSIKIGNGLAGAAARYLSIVTNATSNLFEAQVKDADVLDSLGEKVTAITALGTGGKGVIGWLSQIWNVQTNKTQYTQLTNGTNEPNLKTISTQVVAGDYGFVTNSIMHAATTSGPNPYVDVKANPSGALTVEVNGNTDVGSAVPDDAVMIGVKDSSGLVRHLTLDSAGKIPVSGDFYPATQPVSGSVSVGSSALPSGAATATIQNSQLTQETNISTSLGFRDDIAATADSGTFTVISLIKRGLERWTTLFTKLPPALGAQVAGSSLSVTQASSTSFAVVDVVRTPTYGESLVITEASVVTITAPLTARSMKVQADNTNIVNLRYKIAATPTANSGHQLEPGRSEDWTVAGDVQVIAESTATGQKISVTWGS